MWQNILTYIQSFQQPTTLIHSPVLTPEPRTAEPIDIEYQDVTKVILITEVIDSGQEVPVAFAYITDNGKVTVAYFDELAEDE